MRPPGGILAPGESIIATVFKFVEHPENNEKPLDQKCKVKFKIVSLKVKGPMEYVPELVNPSPRTALIASVYIQFICSNPPLVSIQIIMTSCELKFF
jgi:hypothetical protein